MIVVLQQIARPVRIGASRGKPLEEVTFSVPQDQTGYSGNKVKTTLFSVKVKVDKQGRKASHMPSETIAGSAPSRKV